MEKVVKKLTKKNTIESIIVETNLINKEEVFKMLALAQSTGRAILLMGDPGTAKTKCVIDYAKAWITKDSADASKIGMNFMEKVYILETDEGTKSSEIKGMPDLGLLLTQNKYEILAPITEAKIIIVNEIDKASSNIRNSLLGIMNEKFLFSGKEKIPCKWELLVATCNEIPKDEINSPFWDRFLIKHKVNRISAGDMIKYYEKGGKDYKEVIEIALPSKGELSKVDVVSTKLEKFVDVSYTKCSDRTLTFVPLLSQAVSYIWNCSIDKSLVKVADIMMGKSISSELQNKLMNPEIKTIMGMVDMLQSYNDTPSIDKALVEIEELLTAYAASGKIDEIEVKEMETAISYVLTNHPVKRKEKEIDGLLETIEGDDIDIDPLSMGTMSNQAVNQVLNNSIILKQQTTSAGSVFTAVNTI